MSESDIHRTYFESFWIIWFIYTTMGFYVENINYIIVVESRIMFILRTFGQLLLW